MWETGAEARDMVLTLRPADTWDWSETEVAQLGARETLVGVALPNR